MTMILRHKGFQLSIAILLGAIILVLPRPDGTTFKIVGDLDRSFSKRLVTGLKSLPMPILIPTRIPFVHVRQTSRTTGNVSEASRRHSSKQRDRGGASGWTLTEGTTISGDIGGTDFLVYVRADSVGDYCHFDWCPSGCDANRRCQNRLGTLHAPGRCLHHVLSNFRHCAGQGGYHQTAGTLHRGQSGHQRDDVYLHHQRGTGTGLLFHA
jgi:hypothetical protein